MLAIVELDNLLSNKLFFYIIIISELAIRTILLLIYLGVNFLITIIIIYTFVFKK